MLSKIAGWALALLGTAAAASAAPPGYTVIRSSGGATLYHNGAHFVQVVRLDQGGEIRFQNGTKTGPGGFDPMNCEDLETFWGWMSGNADAFAVSNGQFFNYPSDPAGLAFTVKANDVMIHRGYGVNDPAECQNQIMVEIWETYARFSTFDRNWSTVEASSAPNVIVALREDCPKSPTASIPRTFIGSQDANADQKDETFFILNSQSCTQAQAASILGQFGASHVAMLDGGGSTQMICQGTDFVPSTRQVPQTLGSVGSQHYRCAYHDQSNNPNWMWARPGQLIEDVWVEFENTGGETWVQAGGVENQRCVELWACGADGRFTESPVFPGSPQWTNRIRVKPVDQASVPPQGVARFTFDILVPQIPSQDLHAFFRPVHGGQRMYNWGGMSLPIHVDADAPLAPPGVTVNPAGCVGTNSFTFAWTAPSDPGGSGVAGYGWKVNGSGETWTTATSLGSISAPNAGWNAFYVRAKDGVGNWSGYSSVQFCWEPANGPNLSFEDDVSPQDGVPDGWTVLVLNGAGYDRRGDGGPDGSCYMRFANYDTQDWSAIGRPASGVFQSGIIYRLSFWYRTWSTAAFGWQLSTPGLQSSINVLNATVSGPLGDGVWHRFWGAPFMVSGGQISDYTFMRFLYGSGVVGVVDIDGVLLEQVQLCQ